MLELVLQSFVVGVRGLEIGCTAPIFVVVVVFSATLTLLAVLNLSTRWRKGRGGDRYIHHFGENIPAAHTNLHLPGESGGVDLDFGCSGREEKANFCSSSSGITDHYFCGGSSSWLLKRTAA